MLLTRITDDERIFLGQLYTFELHRGVEGTTPNNYDLFFLLIFFTKILFKKIRWLRRNGLIFSFDARAGVNPRQSHQSMHLFEVINNILGSCQEI